MTRDLRSALAEAARVSSLPDTELIWQRSRSIVRRRRIVRALTVLAVVGGGWAVWGRLDLGLLPEERTAVRPRSDVVQLRESDRPMSPGIYRSAEMNPAVELTIPRSPDGWLTQWTTEKDRKRFLYISMWEGSGPYTVAVETFDRVVDPETGATMAWPSDPIAWLKRFPSVEVTALPPATFGDVHAVGAKVVSGDWPNPRCGPNKGDACPSEILLSRSGFVLMNDTTAVMYFIEHGDGLIAFVAQAPTENFDWFMERAAPILRSIRIRS